MTNSVTGNSPHLNELREWMSPAIAESMSELERRISDVSKFYDGEKGCSSCYDRLVQRIRTGLPPSTISDRYQIAIDSLRDQAELKGPTQQGKAIIELAMMLQFDYSRQEVYMTATSAAVECNAVDIVKDELRSGANDYEHLVRSLKVSAPLRYLHRLVVDSFGDKRSKVELGECSEKLQSIFAEAAHSARVRRAAESMRFFFGPFNTGNKVSDALQSRVREIGDQEFALVAEQSAPMKVMEALNDHEEMAAVDEADARKAWDGSGPEPFSGLPIPVRRQQTLDHMQVQERWKAEELLGKKQVDAIKIVFDFGRTRAMR
ncbi:MAG: hypothetical protein ACOYKZ_02845 [Chlamydiia bacterium]